MVACFIILSEIDVIPFCFSTVSQRLKTGGNVKIKFITSKNVWMNTKENRVMNNENNLLIPTTVITAATSFFLGYILKHKVHSLANYFVKRLPGKSKMVLVVRTDLGMTKGEV